MIFVKGTATVLGALIAASAQIGDLEASLPKRTRNVQERSQLSPGHDGVLDPHVGMPCALPVHAHRFQFPHSFPTAAPGPRTPTL